MEETYLGVIVKKWGSTAFVRSPAAVMTDVDLCVSKPVDLRGETGRITIEPNRVKLIALIG